MLAYTAGPDHDLAGLGGGLQPGGGVHGVAGEHPVARSRGALDVHEHLAGLDADPHRERRLALGREAAVQLGQDGLHLERGADGALGVVLVRARHAEHGEHGVAHELLEQPS